MSLESLPREDVEAILLQLKPEDIFSFCEASRRHRNICDSSSFWMEKARRDFGTTLTPYEMYQQARRKQPKKKLGDLSPEIYLPSVYHYLGLYSSNPSYYYSLIEQWLSHPNELIQRIMRDDLIKWESTLDGNLSPIYGEIQQALEDGWNAIGRVPSQRTIVKIRDGVMESIPTLEKRLEKGPDMNDVFDEVIERFTGGIPDDFIEEANQIKRDTNPKLYDDIWRFLDRLVREAEPYRDGAPMIQGKLYREFLARHPEFPDPIPFADAEEEVEYFDFLIHGPLPAEKIQ